MTTLIQMLILVLIVVAGFFSEKAGIMDSETEKKLSRLIIYLTCPMLIASSVMGDTLPDRNLIPPLFVVGCVTYLLLWVFAVVLPRFFVSDVSQRGIYGFMLMFGNCGFMGYPVVASLFGSHAVFYAALLNIWNTFFIFLVGWPLVSGNGAKPKFSWSLLWHPAMVASYFATAIVALGIDSIPRVIATPVTLIGNITVPGALLIIGSSMARMRVRQLFGTLPIYVMTPLRLLVIPLAIYFTFKAVGVNDFVNQVNTMLIAMPVATFGTMFCLQANRDATSMVQGTMITTVLSVITIPIITLLF